MTLPLSQIERLLPLLETAYQSEQMKMAKIVQRIDGLKRQLQDLDRPHRADPMSVATLAGADLRWDAWAHDRKLLINQELARVLGERENARGAMANALAKREAALKMHQRATLAARRLAERRASW